MRHREARGAAGLLGMLAGALAVALLAGAGCSGERQQQPGGPGEANSPAGDDANDANAVSAFDRDGFLAGTGESLLPRREGGRYMTPVVAPTPERVDRLQLPDGFSVGLWAKGLGRIRMMALGPDGEVYITHPRRGGVLKMADTDGDGQADVQEMVVDLDRVHGLYVHEGKTMYLATVGEVFTAGIDGGKVGEPKRIVTGMPTARGHHNRTLAIGPDGRLYITVGSTCNCCWEKNPENATMLVAEADGSNRRIFARGLRNTIGFGWHPKTGELWGMDHGIDWLGPDRPVEELNHIRKGRHYGWPWVYGDRNTIPIERHEAIGSLEEFAPKTTPPVLGYQAHSSPIAMVFYTGEQFPQEYRNDAFVAFHGSWNRNQPVGYEVVRVVFDDDGRPQRFEKFLTGFLVTDVDKPYAFGRPAGLVVLADGSLLVGDDAAGAIYRVSYDGER